MPRRRTRRTRPARSRADGGGDAPPGSGCGIILVCSTPEFGAGVPMTEGTMSDNYQKNQSVTDRVKEVSGVYKAGVDPESAKGLMLPFIVFGVIVVVFGGLIVSL